MTIDQRVWWEMGDGARCEDERAGNVVAREGGIFAISKAPRTDGQMAERWALRRALVAASGNQRRAAERLGLPYSRGRHLVGGARAARRRVCASRRGERS